MACAMDAWIRRRRRGATAYPRRRLQPVPYLPNLGLSEALCDALISAGLANFFAGIVVIR